MNLKVKKCYARAMSELHAIQADPPSVDDWGMCKASGSDLRLWVFDLRDRVGLDVDGFSKAIEAYIDARNP